MDNSHTSSSPGFREAFERCRETTISAFVTAVETADRVICDPVNGVGMFGWQFEGTDPEHAASTQGGMAFGKAYLRHMVNQGFDVAFAVWRENGQALVSLKVWEGDEPPWLRSTQGAFVWIHEGPDIVR